MDVFSEMESPSRPSALFRDLAVLSLLAFGLRLLLALWTTTIAGDAALYLITAEAFARGDLVTTFAPYNGIHPLYPILTAVVGVPTSHMLAAAYGISVLSSALAVIPLFLLIRAWWDRRVAWWTGFLYALHPTLSMEGSEVMLTGLFIALVITAVVLFVFSLRGGHFALFPLAGLAAALAYLTRPEGLVLVLFFGVGVVAAAVGVCRGRASGDERDQPASPRWMRGLRLAAGVMSLATVSLLVTGPYLVWLHAYCGHWVVTGRGSSQILWENLKNSIGETGASLPPDSDQPEQKPASPVAPPVATVSTAAPSGVSENHPSKANTVTAASVVDAADPFLIVTVKKLLHALYSPLLPLLLVGLMLRRFRMGRSSACLALGGMALTFWAVPILAYELGLLHRPSHRYLLPGIVFVFPWMAASVIAVEKGLSSLRTPRVAGIPTSLLRPTLLLILAAALLGRSVRPRRAEEVTFLDTGAWLRQQQELRTQPLLSTSEKISYYGGCRHAPLPQYAEHVRWVYHPDRPAWPWEVDAGQPAAIVVSDYVRRTWDYYRKDKAALFALDEKSLRHYGPDFRESLEAIGFELVIRFGPPARPGAVTVWVYRLR